MTLPVVRAEVAWTTDPLTRPGPGDWTDLTTETAGPRSLSVQRGVRVKTGEIEAGVATAIVDNRGRELDPENADSPWDPNVKPRRRIRFYVDPEDGSEQLVFTGFIDRLPTRWTHGDGWVELEAVDLLGILAESTLPRSVLEAEILALQPLSYWPLGEESGLYIDDLVGNANGRYTRPVTPVDPIVPYDTRKANVFTAPVTGQAAQEAIMQTGSQTEWLGAVAFWIQTATRPSVPMMVWGMTSPLGDDFYAIEINPDGRLQVRLQKTGISVTDTYEAEYDAYVADGHPHLVALQIPAGDPLSSSVLYLDGVEKFTRTLLPTISLASAIPNAGTTRVAMYGAAQTEGTQVIVSHLVHFGTSVRGGFNSLSRNDVVTLYWAGMSAWDGDNTGTRLWRILDTVGVDDNDRDFTLSTGTQRCGPTLLDNQSALEYVIKIAATEGGVVYVTTDGKIALRERPANSPTAAATITDDPAGDSGIPYLSVTPEYSLDSVVNIAEVRREFGDVQRSEVTTSVAAYGPRTVTLNTLHRTPAGARSAAARLTNRNQDPRTVFTSATVSARRADTPSATVFGVDIGDAVTIKARPTGGGDPIEQTSIVERVEHELTAAGEWVTSFGMSEHTTLPTLAWDTAGRGWDESVWPDV